MESGSFMDRLRVFFGLYIEPPRNDFRNPIWGDDDEDGDELFERQASIDVYADPAQLHMELSRQVQDMVRSFGSIFGDMKTFFNDEQFNSQFPAIGDSSPPQDDTDDSNTLRNYYLKPGYQNRKHNQHKDTDLDGRLSSNDISGLFRDKKDSQTNTPVTPFNGNIVPGRSFCQTIITTSVTKPDGTIETRRIVKNGNEVTEETTTTIPGNEPHSPRNTAMESFLPDNMYRNIFSEFSSLWRNFY